MQHYVRFIFLLFNVHCVDSVAIKQDHTAESVRRLFGEPKQDTIAMVVDAGQAGP